MLTNYLINEAYKFHYDVNILINSHSGEEVNLTPICSKILLTLCENPRKILSHREIQEKGWGERHREVQNGTYYQTLLMLRKSFKVMGCEADIIRTIPRKGLMLDATVSPLFNEGDSSNRSTPMLNNTIELYKEDGHTKHNDQLCISKKHYILLLMISLFFLCIGMYFNRESERYNFKNIYKKVNTLPNQCHYYVNNDANNVSPHMDFLKKNPEICTPDSYIYITAYTTTRQLSAIRCSYNPIMPTRKGNCVTFYFHNYTDGDK